MSRKRAPKKGNGTSKKIANNLVALGSAAVLTVYTAGYLRTRSAAERFEKAVQRRTTEPAAGHANAAAALRPPATASVAPVTPAAVSTSAAPASAAPARSAGAPPSRMAPSQSAPSSMVVPGSAPVKPSELPVAQPTVAPPAVPNNEPAVPEGDQKTSEPAVAATAEQPEHYKDGTYLGWGSCRHGDIQASVVVERGQIVAAGIQQCLTRYSCSWIAALPSQVVSRQSTDLDYVSGATQSTEAFEDAIDDALSKAR